MTGFGLLRSFWRALCGHKKVSTSFSPQRVETRLGLKFEARPLNPRQQNLQTTRNRRLRRAPPNHVPGERIVPDLKPSWSPDAVSSERYQQVMRERLRQRFAGY